MDERLWRLEHPWVLALGLALALALLVGHRGRVEAVAGGAATLARRGLGRWLVLAWPRLLTAAALLMGLVAWANPQHGVEVSKTENYGVALMHVVDTSESMQALDFGIRDEALTRMEGAVEVLGRFAGDRTTDLQGLMVFGDQVFTLVPLTGDWRMVQDMAGQLESGMAGRSTALGEAMALGVKRLRNAPTESRVMIVMSDGKNNTGEVTPEEAAEFAKEAGVRIYTVGIGGDGPAPFKVDTLFGERVRKLHVEMDKETLQDVAEATGGRYFDATNVSQLDQVYAAIDKLEKSPFEATVSVAWQDHYPRFLRWGLWLMLAAAVGQAAGRRFPAV